MREKSAILKKHFSKLSHKNKIFLSIGYEALHFFIVLNSLVHILPRLSIFSCFLLDKSHIVVADKEVVIVLLFAGGVGAIVSVLHEKRVTLMESSSWLRREIAEWQSFYLVASNMTLSLRDLILLR